ncbi:MAG TPA: class I SAM-dependent DNA methyltransferase, partial [Verrucomicrobiota bacterium]|nr:class I SAM-dependent DNA methyltransferase [Verrucomicrobiota bacterium]
MSPAEFKTKWARVSAKESAAYQSHFDDLCRMLGVPPPLEADPSGEDFFCYQKGVIKDAGLLPPDEDGGGRPKKGFADVWKKGCFGWEYKGQHKDLEEADNQLKLYREALENPPLLIVCDFRRYVFHTNFTGTAPDRHEFVHDQIDRPEVLRLLRAAFTDPDALKPQRTTAQITERLAAQIAEVAKSLQRREAVELADARTRAEANFAARKNLRIARFLNRIVFCCFAEDTGLLPTRLFSDLLKAGLEDPAHCAVTLENLFAVMARGGTFGKDKVRHFNGHLFEESTVFELNAAELKTLADAAEADWQFIQPSIMGTLFERALEPEQRSQLGAHYTGEADIRILVEPVLMAPLRREWAELKSAGAGVRKLEAFQRRLASTMVLDPACGSGNFLYVALQLLLDLEKEVITHAAQLGFRLAPRVGVPQLRALEINPYAYELAQVSVQIGWLQWRRDNGFPNHRSPVLQDLAGFQNGDPLLVPHFRSKAKSLKEAQAGEHAGGDALKFYTEREWPKCDVIVGNPPFLGGKLLRRELGDAYVAALFGNYAGRVRPEADLCCYWFEQARKLIEQRRCRRAGLLATQGIRGGANRDTLRRIKESGDIFFAESD